MPKEDRPSLIDVAALIVGAAATAVGIYLLERPFAGDPFSPMRTGVPFALIGLGIIALGVLLVRTMSNYLNKRPGVFTNYDQERLRVDLAMQQERLRADLAMQIEALKVHIPTTTVSMTSHDREALLSDAVSEVLQAISPQLLDQIRSSLERELNAAATISLTTTSLSKVVNRLGGVADEMRQRANLNLIMGTVACSLGVILLMIIVFVFPGDPQASWQELLVRALPRLSLVLIIELVGYFFLGLYRLGTFEVKYFQNEVTNVELWTASYINALRIDDSELLKDVVKKLLSVERNFILKKGESMALSPAAGDEDKEGARADIRALIDLAKTLKKKPEGKE